MGHSGRVWTLKGSSCWASVFQIPSTASYFKGTEVCQAGGQTVLANTAQAGGQTVPTEAQADRQTVPTEAQTGGQTVSIKAQADR